jgi:hypothetical protein
MERQDKIPRKTFLAGFSAGLISPKQRFVLEHAGNEKGLVSSEKL